MLKAQKSVIMFFMIMMPLCFFAGASVASADCDEGPSSAGPTVTEDFTPLPDPSTAYQNRTLVVVNIADRYMVWDPITNQYAKIPNSDNTQYISFPCSAAELGHWLNSTSFVSSHNLYSRSLAGDNDIDFSNYLICELHMDLDEGQCDSCDDSISQPSELTACSTELFKTYDRHADGCRLHSNMDDYSWDITFSKVLPAKSNELFYSHQMLVANNSGAGSTCARTSKTINSTIQQYQDTSHSDLDMYDYKTAETEYKIVTPLGDLLSGLNLKMQMHTSYRELSDDFTEEDFIDSDGRSIVGFYTDTVMVQIYLYQYCKGHRNRPCGIFFGSVWVPSQCSWEEQLIEDRVELIQAQLNVFPDASSVDPTSLSRNGSFEQALLTLLNDFNSLNGIGKKEIGATSFTISFKQ